jgi:head-tail adaptor
MITSGAMNHVCVVERATSTADDVGQPIKSWTTLETFFAKVMSFPVGEQLIGEQTGAYMNYTITTRKTTAAPGDRIVTEGHTVEIKSIGIRNFTDGLEATIEGVERVS